MTAIPEIKVSERERTYDGSLGRDERTKELRDLVDRLSPDILRDYVRRGALPKELLDRLRGPATPGSNPIISSPGTPTVESLRPAVSVLAAERTARAVVHFLEEAAPPGKKNADSRILVTLDPATGAIDHLRLADPADKSAETHADGRLSLTVGVRFDKKNNVTRLIIDPATKTALHKLGEGEISPELRQALGALHGRPIELPSRATAASRPSPLATGALSLGGLLAVSPEMLEVGGVATAAVLLGRVLFRDSGAKPSYFRRFLHLFSREMALKDWSGKAATLHRGRPGGKIEDTRFAYEKAIDLAAGGPSTQRWFLQSEYGSFFNSIGDYGNAVKQFEAAQQTIHRSREPVGPSFSRVFDTLIHDAARHWGQGAASKGDFLTAARAFEKAARFAPTPDHFMANDPRRWTVDQGRLRLEALARAWQNYARTGGDITAEIKSIIKIANSFGISGDDVRQMAIHLDAHDKSNPPLSVRTSPQTSPRHVTAASLDFSRAMPVISAAQKFVIPIPAAKGEALVYPEGTRHPKTGEDLSGQPITDWQGNPIGDQGMVFLNAKDNSWQAVKSDGNGVIIINQVSEGQAARLAAEYRRLKVSEGVDVGSLKKLIEYARSLGLADMYNSDVPFIRSKMTPVQPGSGLSLDGDFGFVKRDDRDICQAVYLPGPLTFEGPAATPQEFPNGAFIVRQGKDVRGVQPEIFAETYRMAEGGGGIGIPGGRNK